MELLAFVLLLVVVGILAITRGSGSRPNSDDRIWWPGFPADVYPQQHA